MPAAGRAPGGADRRARSAPRRAPAAFVTAAQRRDASAAAAQVRHRGASCPTTSSRCSISACRRAADDADRQNRQERSGRAGRRRSCMTCMTAAARTGGGISRPADFAALDMEQVVARSSRSARSSSMGRICRSASTPRSTPASSRARVELMPRTCRCWCCRRLPVGKSNEHHRLSRHAEPVATRRSARCGSRSARACIAPAAGASSSSTRHGGQPQVIDIVVPRVAREARHVGGRLLWFRIDRPGPTCSTRPNCSTASMAASARPA